jgi:hypothetical protein
MKLKSVEMLKLILQNQVTKNRVKEMMVNHFNYSIADIKSYDELTQDEKKIIPKDIFDEITEEGKVTIK